MYQNHEILYHDLFPSEAIHQRNCSVINLVSPCGDIALWLGQYPDITPEKDKLYSAYI